jgi:uncharacterized RDD family membrane protein YckC
LEEERVGDPLGSDEAFAEWFAWAKREVSPDPAVCMGVAQAAVEASSDGADRATAERTARKAPAGQVVLLTRRVSSRTRAYAEWYDWARREVGGDPARLHRAAAAALGRLESGGDAHEAARAARLAVGEPEPAAEAPSSGAAQLEKALEAATVQQGPMPEPPARPSLMYAGFWRRFLAWAIDAVILFVLFVVSFVFFIAAPGVVDNDGVIWPFLLFWVIMLWGYFAGLECSSLQGTLGKSAVGIVVTDLRGRRAGFGRTTGRHFARWISALILGIGFFIAAFTPQKQALHDMISGTLVVRRDYVPLVANMAERGVSQLPPPPTPTYTGAYGTNP